jgi:hypothetical protein
MTPLESPQKARETVTEIPEEIAISAEAVFEAILSKAYKAEGFCGHYRLLGKPAREIIATALHEAVKAERERCAAVADWYSQASVHAEWTDEARGAGYYACADVARDIRFPKPVNEQSKRAFDAGDDLPF